MRPPQMFCGALWLSTLLLPACGNPERAVAPAPGDQVTAPAPAEPVTGATPPTPSDQPFLRVNLEKANWQLVDGNDVGVEAAVIDGDPTKPGYYLIVNRFPPGVMSGPHYHPDDRHAIVLKGTWYTDEGGVFRPQQTVPLKPGDYMRHPAGKAHYDGALDEEVIVAISGTGPTRSVSVDGGARFRRSK